MLVPLEKLFIFAEVNQRSLTVLSLHCQAALLSECVHVRTTRHALQSYHFILARRWAVQPTKDNNQHVCDSVRCQSEREVASDHKPRLLQCQV